MPVHAVLLVLLVSWCLGCERTDLEVYQEMQALIDQASTAPAPMEAAAAADLEARCLEDLSRLANSEVDLQGQPVRLLAARAAFQLAGVMLHRHRDPRSAKRLMFGAKDVFTALGTPAALAQVTVLQRKLETLDGRFEGDRLDGATGAGEPAAVGGAQN